MQFFTLILVLLGLTINLNAVASVIGPNSRDDSLDTMTNQTETTDTVAFINTTTLGGWPPFYSTSDPQNLCGDTVGIDKSSRGVPDFKDCAALRDKMDGIPGLWNITAGSGRSDNYILLASHASCALTAAPLDSSKDCLIGSKDARDLLNDQATKFSKYSIFSTMGRTNNAATKWAVVRT
ncbi:hypothetical protein VSDG_07667 [Cytospora chrysosperma]|uniref:Ecp2 effector protein-like domain-containing protein n=1 Tax=Cytospora chrysosperma TaxID=252740 RepID=A0A423VJ85_CYTCH|nr:hypothetical protein VSDG_07667 [Valsa sordida]